jgi:hypothetical protein
MRASVLAELGHSQQSAKAGDEFYPKVGDTLQLPLCAAVARLNRSQTRNEKRPPTEAALPLILGPGLLTALTPEHADPLAIAGIEHGQNQRGLVAAMTACPDWIGFEAGKDLVLKFVFHGQRSSSLGRNSKSQSEHSFPDRDADL